MACSKSLTSDLLSSLAGILIFISVNHAIRIFVDINKFTQYQPYLIAFGILLMIVCKEILNTFKNVTFINETTLQTLAYIMIFIGIKEYLDDYMFKLWWLYLIVGVILLSKHESVTDRLFRS